MKLKIFACISGAILLMVAAFFYGYPLVTADTSAYIYFGFSFGMPVDRPPFYGTFLRHSSLWASLWYTILAQSLIVSFLLIRYIKYIYHTDPGIGRVLINLLAIISATCVTWVCSYLMPDVFGGILLLAVLLFLLESDVPRIYRIAYLLLICFSVITHNSHIIILGMFSGLLLLTALRRKQKAFIAKSLGLLGISIGAFFSMCCLNYFNGGQFTFSKGSHVFMMGKLVETGVLNEYLEDNCGRKNLSLCQYKDELPNSSMTFLWQMDGPLYKTGGWEQNRPEYKAIIKDIFTTPKYGGRFFLRSLTSTFRQLTQVQVGRPDQNQARHVQGAIHQYFPGEEKEFTSGGQFNWDKEPAAYNKFYLLALVISSIWVLAIYPHLADKDTLLILYTLLATFIICNAFVTATFANVLDRLNTKVFWLLPATNIIIIIRHLTYRQFSR